MVVEGRLVDRAEIPHCKGEELYLAKFRIQTLESVSELCILNFLPFESFQQFGLTRVVTPRKFQDVESLCELVEG